jgi:DNA-binding response OmpR family regulator
MPEPSDSPLRVLVVEDDRELRDMVTLMVKRMGYAVVTAANGKDAFVRLREQAVDIVLLDLMMPEMDGFEFCQKVREDPALRDLHIIIISAMAALEDKVRRLELGAADFLTKPFRLTELQARIKVGERNVRFQKALLPRLEERTRHNSEFHQIARTLDQGAAPIDEDKHTAQQRVLH